MFLLFWDSAMHVLSHLLEHHEDPRAMAKTLEGFATFARICATYGLVDSLNSVVIYLSNFLSKILADMAFERSDDYHIQFGVIHTHSRSVSCCLILFTVMAPFTSWTRGQMSFMRSFGLICWGCCLLR
eukprot:GABV01000868.1.p1 GENE.GABV01000868.1~~GABV01000868.1.p1  ORF type:complete len:128 (+),score=24.49 GABV01000868.1:239-622(+)